jgi:hypothetical protein
VWAREGAISVMANSADWAITEVLFALASTCIRIGRWKIVISQHSVYACSPTVNLNQSGSWMRDISPVIMRAGEVPQRLCRRRAAVAIHALVALPCAARPSPNPLWKRPTSFYISRSSVRSFTPCLELDRTLPMR